MPEFDTSLLLSTLRDELRAAWASIRAAHAQDGLYGFGVYTTDSASELAVTAFSDAGLDAALAASLASKRGQGRDPALQREYLRWSLADSPLHEAGTDLLPESDQMLQELHADDDDADEEADFDEGSDFDEDADYDDVDDEGEDLAQVFEEVFETVVEALQEMDEEGLFGAGAERERLVVGVWKSDQSNLERYEFASQLNPPAVARRFGAELNAGNRAFYKLYLPDEDPPKDDVFT
jgi:hypothetical protein